VLIVEFGDDNFDMYIMGKLPKSKNLCMDTIDSSAQSHSSKIPRNYSSTR